MPLEMGDAGLGQALKMVEERFGPKVTTVFLVLVLAAIAVFCGSIIIGGLRSAIEAVGGLPSFSTPAPQSEWLLYFIDKFVLVVSFGFALYCYQRVSDARKAVLTEEDCAASVPWDTDGHAALRYAMYRSWPAPSSHDTSLASDIERMEPVLRQFYDLARNGHIRVWGRPGGRSYVMEPVEKEHWSDFQIMRSTISGMDGPVRTVARSKNPRGLHYEDLHLNLSEMKRFWPESKEVGNERKDDQRTL